MFRNYFITAVRNLWRSKSSTIINLSGLTLGIASSLLLFLMVRFQSSFDNFNSKGDRIYRVVTSSDGNQGRNYTPGVPPVLPEAFKNDFPEAEEVLFTSYRAGGLVTIPQKVGEPKKYEEERGIVYTDPTYFKIFDRKVLSGDATKGLDDPNEAIISKKAALKYFGKEDALGELLSFEKKDFKVTAIVEDTPSNTDFPFDVLLSYITIKKEREENGWNGIWSDEQCYFLLKKDASLDAMDKRMPAFIKKYHGENRNKQAYNFQPLAEIHYDDRFSNYSYNTTSKQTLTALSLVGIFLIITACINFINLVTAEAIKRSKEVGIRKSLGSSRAQLIIQFLGESSMVTLISVIVAVSLTQILLGWINPFLDLKLSLDFVHDSQLWMFLGAVTFVVALLSGLYPSLVVSGFKPVFAIKNNIDAKNSSGYTLRRGLVVLQFVISQFFIMGTIVLISQMNYLKNKDLGFKKDAIVNIPVPERESPATSNGSSKMRTLREETLRLKGVENASLCNTPPSSGSVQGTDFQIEGKEDHYGTQVKLIDSHYIELFGLQLLAGNNLADLDTAQGFVVNEKLSSMVGFTNPNDIIGKRIKMWGKDLPVVGVVKNFHTVSLQDPIEATIMLNRIRNYETLSLKLNPTELQATIKEVQQKWEATSPDFIFSYEFLDVQIKEFYEREEKMSILLTVFTSLAIFIGCLGLFGLATFMANQKTKEIGVRKVLGASVESIIFMFSKEYIRLIVVGFVLAAPFAWFVMNKWLDKFAYKIEIGPTIFIAGIAVTAMIAIITVGYKSFSAATANPVKSLRSE
jgi:ABC-type antimicrobial peptide transport system permease subunit